MYPVPTTSFLLFMYSSRVKWDHYITQCVLSDKWCQIWRMSFTSTFHYIHELLEQLKKSGLECRIFSAAFGYTDDVTCMLSPI